MKPDLVAKIEPILRAQRPKLLKGFGTIDAKEKDDRSVVTALDIEVEEILKKALAEVTPESGFIGEESGGSPQSSYWVIDPIDGTDYYVRGIKNCATYVALVQEGAVVLGIMYDFIEDLLYFAEKDAGAYCEDRKLSVSGRPLEGAKIVSEIGDREYYQSLCDFGLTQQVTMPWVSSAGWIDLAEGRTDAVLYKQPWAKLWDVAAGSIIAREAGAVVANLYVDSYDLQNLDVIAANPAVYQALRAEKLV